MTIPELIELIDQQIRKNENGEISAPILNSVLKSIIDVLADVDEDSEDDVSVIKNSLTQLMLQLTDGQSEDISGLADVLIQKAVLIDLEKLKDDLIDPEEIMLEAGAVTEEDLQETEFSAQYSPDGQNWHSGFQQGDEYMRTKKGNENWSDPIFINTQVKSPYDIAVENGYKGSEREWLASLKGKDGKGAYEIWKEQVNPKGTMQDYLNWQKGKAGDDGKDVLEYYQQEINPGGTIAEFLQWVRGGQIDFATKIIDIETDGREQQFNLTDAFTGQYEVIAIMNVFISGMSAHEVESSFDGKILTIHNELHVGDWVQVIIKKISG